MPEPTEGPTVLRILLGIQLRRLRESRGMTLPRRQRLEGEHASLQPTALKQRLERAVMEFERLRTRPAFRQPANAAV